MIHQVMLVIKFSFIFNLETGTEISSCALYLGVSSSSLCTVFFIDFIILSALFSLYGKSRKFFFLLFSTSSCDELVGNCYWCCSCSCWWLLPLISEKTLLIAQNGHLFCSWKTFLMWHNSFCKSSFVEQISIRFSN